MMCWSLTQFSWKYCCSYEIKKNCQFGSVPFLWESLVSWTISYMSEGCNFDNDRINWDDNIQELTYWGWDKNGRHFPDDTFKRIFFNENVSISIKISLNFVPKSPINNIPAVMVSLPTHICVTRPQWIIRAIPVYSLASGNINRVPTSLQNSGNFGNHHPIRNFVKHLGKTQAIS